MTCWKGSIIVDYYHVPYIERCQRFFPSLAQVNQWCLLSFLRGIALPYGRGESRALLPRSPPPPQRFCFFHKAPLFIKLQSAWGHVAHAWVMAPLGVVTCHPEQAR